MVANRGRLKGVQQHFPKGLDYNVMLDVTRSRWFAQLHTPTRPKFDALNERIQAAVQSPVQMADGDTLSDVRTCPTLPCGQILPLGDSPIGIIVSPLFALMSLSLIHSLFTHYYWT